MPERLEPLAMMPLPVEVWAEIVNTFELTLTAVRELAALPASERGTSKDLVISAMQEMLQGVTRACPGLDTAHQISDAIEYALLPEPAE